MIGSARSAPPFSGVWSLAGSSFQRWADLVEFLPLIERTAPVAKPLSDTTIRARVDDVQTAERNRARSLEQGQAKLHRPDGQPRYSQAEMADQVRALEDAVAADFDEVHGSVRELAYTEIREGEQEIEVLDAQDRNPLAQLDPTETGRAASLRPFAESDVNVYSAAELRPQVQAAIATADRPMMVVWHRALLGRAREVDGVQRDALVAMADELLRKLRRPEVAEHRKLARQRIDQGRKLLAGVREVTQPLAVAQERARLVASRAYERL